MARVSTTIRTDSDIKEQVQQIFEELGIDMSTAVNIFFRQVMRKNGLPFEVVTGGGNEVTTAAIEAAENGEDMYGPYDSVEALMESLNA